MWLTEVTVLNAFWGHIIPSELRTIFSGNHSRNDLLSGTQKPPFVGAWKITSTSTEGQKLHEILAPVLVIIPENLSGISKEMITSTGFYRYCAPDASAPVVVINKSPILRNELLLV